MANFSDACRRLRINEASIFNLVANEGLKLAWNTDVEFVWLYMIDGVDDEPLQVLRDGRYTLNDVAIDKLRSGLFEIENSQEWNYVFQRLLDDINPMNDVFFDANNLIVREIYDDCKWSLSPLANNEGDNVTYHPVELPKLSRLGVMNSEVERYKDYKKNGVPQLKNLGSRQIDVIKGIVNKDLKKIVRVDESQTGKSGSKSLVLNFIEENLKTRPEFKIFSLGGKGKFERSFFDTAWKKYIQELKKHMSVGKNTSI